MYESLSSQMKQDFSTALAEWTRTMQPLQLESYRRGLFNSRKQAASESVTEFANDLQKLLGKAFANHDMDPSLKDQILLGQFEQGLLIKWKRQLKYPINTFEDALLTTGPSG